MLPCYMCLTSAVLPATLKSRDRSQCSHCVQRHSVSNVPGNRSSWTTKGKSKISRRHFACCTHKARILLRSTGDTSKSVGRLLFLQLFSSLTAQGAPGSHLLRTNEWPGHFRRFLHWQSWQQWVTQRDACLVQNIYKQSNVQRIRMNSTSHSGTHDMHRQQNISGRQCGTHDCHWGCVHQHSAMLAASKVDPGPHPSIYFVWWINFVSRVSKPHEDNVMHFLARYVPLSGLDKGFLCQQSCTRGAGKIYKPVSWKFSCGSQNLDSWEFARACTNKEPRVRYTVYL